MKAADLVETLMGKGRFTKFAPTDEAFAKLPNVTLESLFKPENNWIMGQVWHRSRTGARSTLQVNPI